MSAPWTATALTLFPEMFPGPLGVSLAGKALANGIWTLETMDIRAFAEGRHRTVDDTPAGGGAGMVMRVDVLARAIDAATAAGPAGRPVLYLSPRGPRFAQAFARELAAGPGAIFVCGRFEGVDERIFAARNVRELSLGDFVLSGGELAAMAVMDSCVRLLPGVMGDAASHAEESFENGLLEYPHYTRPQSFEGLDIPAVLSGGHHRQIGEWRKAAAEEITRNRRPDLWAAYAARTDALQTRPTKGRRT
ncbi:MAG: tRNA (guanosine(37)-N1)-methyltransferase TrmD [Alphaproteobacteria bacterium]